MKLFVPVALVATILVTATVACAAVSQRHRDLGGDDHRPVILLSQRAAAPGPLADQLRPLAELPPSSHTATR